MNFQALLPAPAVLLGASAFRALYRGVAKGIDEFCIQNDGFRIQK